MTAIEAQSDREYLALLESVLANPADAAPRLIISDWLEDHGFLTRAELIRMQLSGHDGYVASYTYWMRREWGLFPTPVITLRLDHPDNLKMSAGGGRIAPGPGGIRMSAGLVARAKFDRVEIRTVLIGDIVSITVTHRDRLIGEVTGISRVEGADHLLELEILLDSLTNMDSGWTRGFISSIRMTCDEFMRHAGDLFRRHPITEVTLADKIPQQLPDDTTGRYSWHVTDFFRSYFYSYVPVDLFVLIGMRHGDFEVCTPSFRTSQEAADALCRACVDYGRKLANLPRFKNPR